jgi:probable phosphoglycerate mutase
MSTSNRTQELYLIRHGESKANTDRSIIGGRSNESPLTEDGIEQARLLGRLLLQEEIIPDRVFSSPAARALQTAEHTLKAMGLGIEPVICDGLQELDQGDWTGTERVKTYSPTTLLEIAYHGKDFKAPGGESMNDTRERMEAWSTEYLDPYRPGRTLAFGHGLAIRCFVSLKLGWSQKDIFRTHTPNTSLTLLERDCPGEWDVVYAGRLLSDLNAESCCTPERNYTF